MTDNILAGLQVLGDGERVNVIVCIEDVGRSPSARGILANLVDLEPYSAVLCDYRLSTLEVARYQPLTSFQGSIW